MQALLYKITLAICYLRYTNFLLTDQYIFFAGFFMWWIHLLIINVLFKRTKNMQKRSFVLNKQIMLNEYRPSSIWLSTEAKINREAAATMGSPNLPASLCRKPLTNRGNGDFLTLTNTDYLARSLGVGLAWIQQWAVADWLGFSVVDLIGRNGGIKCGAYQNVLRLLC